MKEALLKEFLNEAPLKEPLCAAENGGDAVTHESQSFLPEHNRQYLDAAYWDERFQKVYLLLSLPRCCTAYRLWRLMRHTAERGW